jgi:hypothetical protein
MLIAGGPSLSRSVARETQDAGAFRCGSIPDEHGNKSERDLSGSAHPLVCDKKTQQKSVQFLRTSDVR